MFKILVFTCVLAVLAPTSFAQAIAGIHVGDPASVLEKLNLEFVARARLGSMKVVKYRLADGNEVSVTYASRTNRIVYIECDWNQEPESAESDFPSFKFGVTTLDDIDRANGSNGFSYQSRAMVKSEAFENQGEGKLVAFNAYSIKNKPGSVVVFMTALDIAEVRRKIAHPRPEDMGKNLKLQALFFAEEDYLDQTWGKERPDNKKIYDKANKPIIWEGDGLANKNKKTSPADEASDEGVRLAHERKYQEAIASFDQAIRLDPKEAYFYNNRGMAYHELNQDERAVQDFDHAIGLDPNDAGFYFHRGLAHNVLRQYQRSVQDFDQAIRLDPKFAEAYIKRGLAYDELNQVERGLKDFDQAIRLKPGYAEAYTTRGLTYYALERYERAITDFNQAIRLDPNLAMAYTSRGLAYQGLKQYERALQDHSQAIRLDPNLPSGFL